MSFRKNDTFKIKILGTINIYFPSLLKYELNELNQNSKNYIRMIINDHFQTYLAFYNL